MAASQQLTSFVEIRKSDGTITSIAIDGKRLLVLPGDGSSSSPSSPSESSMHCLFRAPTCNDRGGIRELLGMLVGEQLAKRMAP